MVNYETRILAAYQGKTSLATEELPWYAGEFRNLGHTVVVRV